MQRIKTKYLSLFFLVGFVTSLSANSIKNLNTVSFSSKTTYTKSLTLSQKENSQNNGSDTLFEENENEVEDGLDVQMFTLPYLISCFQYEVFKPKPIFENPLTKKLTTPIYIEVCNFRI